MSRIGAVTLALNDEATIAGTINCLKKFVDYHVVLISEKSYFGDVVDNGKTEKICADLDVDVIKGYWPLDHHQRTLGNKMCKKHGCDWVITLDSDEMIDEENMKKLLGIIKFTKSKALLVKPEVYWSTTDYVLSPKPDYCPPIAMTVDVEFPYIRNINTPFQVVDVEMHHVSWAEPKDVYKKVTCYAHATDFDGKTWYKNRYENWRFPDPAVLPDGVYNVEHKPLPEELKKCLGRI